MSKFKVGDWVVLVEPRYGRGPADVSTRTIEKVSRKYVYLDGETEGWKKRPFSLTDGCEVDNSNYPARIYTPQEHADRERRAQVMVALKERGILWDSYGEFRNGEAYSITKLEKLLAVLEESEAEKTS